jgi:hypothetical protein
MVLKNVLPIRVRSVQTCVKSQWWLLVTWLQLELVLTGLEGEAGGSPYCTYHSFLII